MKVYFLRHAHASWPHWDGPDRNRPLTQKGCVDARRVAEFLDHAGVKPDTILTSPLPRASQTAEIAAKQLNLHAVTEPALEPGFNAKKLARILKIHAGEDVMIVGHETDFSTVIERITGGRVEMAKGGVACIELEDATSHGRLLWLITPKLLKRG